MIMDRLGTQRCCVLLAALVAAAIAPMARGSLVDVQANTGASVTGLGDLSGSLAYEYSSVSGLGTLTVTLTNDSDGDSGGYITGLLFNLDSDDLDAVATLLPGSEYPFENLEGPARSGMPFGMFDAGAALGGNWEGGGTPAAGVPVGQTAVFRFAIAAVDGADLNAASFIAGPLDFVVRLRGFNNGGSDKVPLMVVPTPAGLGLLVMAGLLGPRRRRR
jgi:hypothetical protein